MKNRLILFLLICIGIGIRLYYAWSSPYNINCDTSTVGMMAVHILQGNIPLFFYGQEYLGPFEALVIAVFFLLFGIKNYAMFYAMIFISVLFMLSTYFLAKEFGNRWSGIIALAFCCIAPCYLVLHNVLPLGYHVEILLLGNILLILTLKLIKQDKLRYYILLGLVSGFAFWTQYIIVYYLVPIAVFLLIKKKWKILLRYSPLVLVCFFLGGLPFWIYTFTHKFGTFGFPPSERQKVLSTIKETFPQTFSTLFNLEMPFFHKGNYLVTLVLLIYIASFIYFALGSLKSHKNLIMVFFFGTIIAFFGIFNYHSLKGCAYYIIPLYSLVPVVFGYTMSKCKGRYVYAGTAMVIFVLGFNGFNTYKEIQKERRDLEHTDRYLPHYIDFLRKNKLTRIICGRAEDYTIQFLTKEEVVITGCGGSEYPPYDFIVERADRVAVSSYGAGGLDAVSKRYRHDYDIYFDIKPYGFVTREILPGNFCADTNYSADLASYAFDRNYDKWWSTRIPRKDGMSFTIDMGKIYPICKFQNFNHDHLYNYPLSCRIQVSKDGINWTEVKYIRCVEPLFWSGPRLYWYLVYGRWEVIFNPVNARYLRLIQEGDGAPHPWEINEIFIYEFIREKEPMVKDYVKSARRIYDFICRKKFSFVYADFWLSAKIRQFSKDDVGALRPFNGNLAGFDVMENTSRLIELKPGTAFVINKENREGFEGIAKEFQFPLAKKEFGDFICYYFTKWNGTYLEKSEGHNWLYWIGTGVVKYNLKSYSNLVCSYASNPHLVNREGYYKKAIKYYPHNYTAYMGLCNLYKRMGLDAEYRRCRNITRHKFIPQIKKEVAFKNGVEFLGYTINRDVAKPGDFIKIDYFWKCEELRSRLFVFVHFINDKGIAFQNDHIFLSNYQRQGKVNKDEIFKESFRVDIPKGLLPGKYKISMGLYYPETKKRVPLKLARKENRVMIGDIQIK